MYYRVREQVDHDLVSGWGYYTDPKTGNRHCIIQFVELVIRIKVDEMHAAVFCTASDSWWIGSKYLHERENFDLKGPYTDVETALTMLRLLGEVKRHFD